MGGNPVEEMLHRLLEVDGVLAASLLSHDGLPVASANLDDDEADTVGALLTAMVASMRATTDRLGVGDLLSTRLTTDSGLIEVFIMQELLLLLITEPNVDRVTLETLLSDVTAHFLEFAL